MLAEETNHSSITAGVQKNVYELQAVIIKGGYMGCLVEVLTGLLHYVYKTYFFPSPLDVS